MLYSFCHWREPRDKKYKIYVYSFSAASYRAHFFTHYSSPTWPMSLGLDNRAFDKTVQICKYRLFWCITLTFTNLRTETNSFTTESLVSAQKKWWRIITLPCQFCCTWFQYLRNMSMSQNSWSNKHQVFLCKYNVMKYNVPSIYKLEIQL